MFKNVFKCRAVRSVTFSSCKVQKLSKVPNKSRVFYHVSRRTYVSNRSRGMSTAPTQYLHQSTFGTIGDKPVTQYTLRNKEGMEVEIINYGAAIRSMKVPNVIDKIVDVCAGLDTIEDYQNHGAYFGCIAGRFANRINRGRFGLNGEEYQLTINNGKHHLHGGTTGFDKYIWNAKPIELKDDSPYSAGLELQHSSPDTDQGYPGDCTVNVRYLLSAEENRLQIDYKVTTDTATIANVTNHSYFSLDGAFHENAIRDHVIRLNCDRFLPINEESIPFSDQYASVEKTAFDFRPWREIQDMVDEERRNPQLQNGKGYDHNFIVNHLNLDDRKLEVAAEVWSPVSLIQMTVQTDQPGLQFYTGNYLDGSVKGKGHTYGRRGAFCLETQHFPDSPNHSNFPSTVVTKDKPFESTTAYSFTTIYSTFAAETFMTDY